MRPTPLTRLALLALLLAMLLGGLPAAPARAAAPSDLDLAFRWAPIHHQDTDEIGFGGIVIGYDNAEADFITAINYDGDWNALNSWENLTVDLSRLKAVAYYSVVETSTHWFILYAFYHPRDWCDVPGCEVLDEHHENDLEGVLTIIRKDGSMFGQFVGMVTVAHSDFYSFTPAGSPLTNGEEDIDGTVVMLPGPDGNLHPSTLQESKGHGLKAWPGDAFNGGHHIVYLPSKTTSEVPASGNDRQVEYQLIDIFAPGGLWDHRFDPATFAGSSGRFRGDNGADNAAGAPWVWNDHDDNPALNGGELAHSPTELVDIYFNGLGTFSHAYWRNPYLSIPGPHNLRLGTVTASSIQLLWNDTVLFATAYEVWRRPVGGSVWTVVGLPANSSAWTHTGLSMGAGYTYKVRACHADGCLAFSNQVTGHAGWKKLTVTKSGKGNVTSSPAGINCGLTGSNCFEFYPPGTVVRLTATPHIAYPEIWDVAGWTGACATTATVCQVTMSVDRSTTATFVEGSVPTDPPPPPGGEQP